MNKQIKIYHHGENPEIRDVTIVLPKGVDLILQDGLIATSGIEVKREDNNELPS